MNGRAMSASIRSRLINSRRLNGFVLKPRTDPTGHGWAIYEYTPSCSGFEVPIIIAACLCRNFKSKTALQY